MRILSSGKIVDRKINTQSGILAPMETLIIVLIVGALLWNSTQKKEEKKKDKK